MQPLLNLNSNVNRGIITRPDWDYIRQGLYRNLSTVIRYYRNNETAVASDHFLVRLLTSIAVPMSIDTDRYYDRVDEIALKLSMSLRMTSSMSAGRIFEGVFYHGCKEILLATTDEFNLRTIQQNWRNLAPVKVLIHPKSDLDLILPDGADHHDPDETGLVVISVNIPMLAMQYRAFRMSEYDTVGPDNQHSIMQFIRMFVLPNMLFSHLDYAVFNRFECLRLGKPFGHVKQAHPFPLPDYQSRINVVQMGIVSIVEKEQMDFATTLRAIPLVVKPNMYEAFTLPDIAPTRQVVWALALAQLPVVKFLVELGIEHQIEKNQMELNQLILTLKAYRSDNLIKTMLPSDMYQDIQSELDTLLRHIT